MGAELPGSRDPIANDLRWPLVGRRRELDRLEREVRRTSAVVAGPGGVGKTRLLAELAERVAASGREVVELTATRTSSIVPLRTVGPLLDGETASPSSPAVVSRIAGRLHDAIVMIDDAHLLDDASAVLVQQLVQRGVTTVMSIRSDARLSDALLAAWRDGHAVRVDLEPLETAAVRDLLDTVLGADVDDATLRLLCEFSGGNLTHLRELVTGARDAEVLVRERDVWRLTNPMSANPALHQMVKNQLDGIPAGARELLELVAVAESMSLRDVEQVADGHALDVLEASGLVVMSRLGRRHRVRVSHPVYREIIKESVTPTRLVAMHRRMAELLGATPLRRREDLLAYAVHRLEGGGQVDSSMVVEAARAAIADGDPRLGGQLAQVAMTAGETAVGGILLAEAQTALGQHAAAASTLAVAATAARADEHVALIAMRRALIEFWSHGAADTAAGILAQASAEMDDPALVDELDAQQATFSLLQGRFDRAVRQGTPILDRGHGRAAIVAAIAVAPARAAQGRGELALAVAARAQHALEQLGPELVMSAASIHVVGRVFALQEMGHLGQAGSEARLGYDEAIACGDVEGQGWLALMLGRNELAGGQLAHAGRYFDEGASVFSGQGLHAQERWCRAGRVIVDAERRDPHTGRSLDVLLSCDPGASLMMEAEVIRAMAWATLVAGRPQRARALASAAADLARSQGATALESLCLHELLRIGGRPDPSRMEALAATVDGDLAMLRARHLDATLVADHDLLSALSDDFERAGAVLLAAEAAAQAGVAHAAARNRGGAERAWRRMDHLVAQTGGARTPLLALRGRSASLTEREFEVARMAATGSSNGEIASELAISHRTVENHLQHAYEKLGVHRRTDLGDVLPV